MKNRTTFVIAIDYPLSGALIKYSLLIKAKLLKWVRMRNYAKRMAFIKSYMICNSLKKRRFLIDSKHDGL